jgi:hypothetical protein
VLESKFQERGIVDKPACPFCAGLLEPPSENRAGEMPMGSCACGAVYICDVTGHNLGSALVDALLRACNGDSDKAWNLSPEEDYLEKQVNDYDLETHRIVHGGVCQGRRISGTLLFIRLNRAVEGNIEPDPSTAQVTNRVSRLPDGKAKALPLSKGEVEAFVASYDMESLLAAAEGEKRILRNLKRLLYSPDELLRRKAAEAMGRVSAVVSRTDPGAVSRLLQELFSSVTDTASSTWGAIDAIGEIIRFQPDSYSSFIPRLAQLSRDRALREDVLRALVKIGHARPDALHMSPSHLIQLLEDPVPAIQGCAAMLIGRLKLTEAKAGLERLRDSRAEVAFYENGADHKKTLGRLAAEALAEI